MSQEAFAPHAKAVNAVLPGLTKTCTVPSSPAHNSGTSVIITSGAPATAIMAALDVAVQPSLEGSITVNSIW